MYEPLPPAAPPEEKSPHCHECQGYNILWRPDFQVTFPLSQFGIGVRTICRRCALTIAEQRALLPYAPSVEDVCSHIERMQHPPKSP